MKFIIIVAATLILTGCDSASERQVKLKEKKHTIVDIGVFDGCTVRYVDRGSERDNFYLAKCNDTDTTTSHWNEQQGKNVIKRSRTVISQTP